MADNTVLSAGAGGDTIATDDIAGIKHQRVKVEFGADGSATDVSSAAPLPVIAGSNSGVDIGDVTINNATGASAVPIQDGGNSITVDGTVAATQSGTWNVTNVSGTVSLPTGAATAAKQPALGTAGTASTDVITIQGIASGTVVPVSDGGGSLTVDAPVGTPAFVRLSDGAAAITTLPVSLASVPSHAVTNAGTFATQVDGAALTALQLIDDAIYAEDVASQAADKGVSVLAVRRDADTSLVGTDGDYANLQVNAAGSLKVAITAGAGSGGTSLADNAGFTPGTTSFTPIGGEVDDTATSAASENSGAAVRITAQRAFHVNLRDNSGNEVSVGGGTQYDEDTAHVSGDKLTMAGVVRLDAAASLAGTDGDRTALQVDANGALRVTGGGGGTEYTVDAAAPAAPTGSTFVMERDDALSALTEVEGDWTNPRASANGALWVAVDGTAAVSNAGLTALNGAISGTEVQVDVLTMPTVTVNAHAVTNAGTFVVQENGAALTALQLIDDTVATLGTTTYTETTTKGLTIGAVRRDADTTLVDTTNEIGPLQMDANGRLKVEAFSGETLPVSLSSVPSHAVTNAGTFATQVDGAALTALQLIDNPVLVDDAAFTPATSSVMMAGFQADESSTDSVDEGDAGAARMTLTRKVIVTPQPHTTGGLTIFRSLDIDESEEEVKASAGVLYSIAAFNRTAAPLYLKFYNATAANVTVGTTTPVLTFVVPGNADSDGAGFILEKTYGWTFDTAISVACTTAVADADTGAPGANDCVINLGYL